MSKVLLVEQTAPETPSAAQALLYVKSDGKFYTKDDAGTEYLVSHANPVTVSEGGTGVTSNTAYAVLCGGTTAAAAIQSIASVGASGQILTSNGAGTLPTFQAAATAATQAEQETGSSTTVYTSPGRQHFHPSAAKAWVNFNNAGTTAASYNITSITDTGAGNWTVNIATDFSTSSYVGVITGGYISTPLAIIYNMRVAPTAGTYVIRANMGGAGGTDQDPDTPNEIHVVFLGDQA